MVNQTPLVTVLIASYNHHEFIEACINSYANQTYSNIQLIVIDDGSTDNSLNLIRELSDRYSFNFISQSNQGLSKVLNKGIGLAQGKYFVSASSDDIPMLDRIEKQVDLLESRGDILICAGNHVEIDENGEVYKRQKTYDARELTFEDIFYRKVVGVSAPTAMCSTEVLRSVGGYDSSVRLEDIYMWLKVTSHGYKIFIMSDVLAYYRKHSNNQSKNIEFMAQNLIKIYKEYSDKPLHDKMINQLLINLFAKAVQRGYPYPFKLIKYIALRYYNFKLFSHVFRWLIQLPFRVKKVRK